MVVIVLKLKISCKIVIVRKEICSLNVSVSSDWFCDFLTIKFNEYIPWCPS